MEYEGTDACALVGKQRNPPFARPTSAKRK